MLKYILMRIAEDWRELMFNLQCLNQGSAKRQFRQTIKYSFGGLCAYCRQQRATTLDHIRPRSKGGGSSLRSNLLPACVECNHSKGSESWLTWYERQDFYSPVARELIEEWINNTQFEDELNDRRINDRATVCTSASEIRSLPNEPTSIREDSLAVA